MYDEIPSNWNNKEKHNVALHVIVGDGTMPSRALTETLNEYKENEPENCWFMVVGKSDPSKTEVALLKWLKSTQTYFEVVCDDPDAIDEIYEGADETHTAKNLAEKLRKLMVERDEGEGHDVLALFVDLDDPEAEDDKWLNGFIEKLGKDDTILALNDGLAPIESSGDEEPAPAAKSKSSKSKAADDEDDEPAAKPKKAKTPTKDELDEMDLPELKEVAKKLGIEVPPRTRQATYITMILNGGAGNEVEVTKDEDDAPKTNGADIGELSESILKSRVGQVTVVVVTGDGMVVSRQVAASVAARLLKA